MKIFINLLSNPPETTNQTALKLGHLYFSAQQFPPSLPSSIFLIFCTLKATEELGRAALQEGSADPQRKSLALLLNSPVSAALSWVSGYRLLAPASCCNFPVVEKCDSFFSESPGATSRQGRGCQCLRNSWGHVKETVWNKEDKDTKDIFMGFRATFYNPSINFL